MAVKTMTPVEGDFNKITPVAFEVATSTTDGFSFKIPCADEDLIILVTNTAATAKKITVKAPTSGSYASTDEDMELSLGAGAFAVIRIESARFANNDATVTLIPEDLGVKAVVVC